MAIDGATAKFLEQMAAAGMKPLHQQTPAEIRAARAGRMAALSGPGPVMARVEEHQVARADGVVPLRLLVPPQPARGVMVYYHGGGWVFGSIDEVDTLGRRLAERTSCVVALAGYRLAPEHRYPVAVDDAFAALQWVAARLPDLAGAGAPLIVAGDSAGGNLAAVVARRARDQGDPAVALQVLIYPVTDANFDRPSYLDPDNQHVLTREGTIWAWDHYCPEPARRTEPDAAPLRAADLSGLPPAVVLTAEHDPLRDEGEEYAARLAAVGVPVDCKRYAGQVHGFFTVPVLPGSERGLQQVVKAVRACIAQRRRATAG